MPFLDVDIRYVYGRYLFGAVNEYSLYKSSIIVKYIRDYIDYINIVLSILFDVATAVKLYYYHRKNYSEWTRQRATLERLFLFQVILDDSFVTQVLQVL